MNAQLLARKTALENILSKEVGFTCELTIRGEKEFTLSAEGCKEFTALVAWFGLQKTYKLAKCETSYDAECDFTCFYFTVR